MEIAGRRRSRAIWSLTRLIAEGLRGVRREPARGHEARFQFQHGAEVRVAEAAYAVEQVEGIIVHFRKQG